MTMTSAKTGRSAGRRRRGSAYLVVVGSAMIVTIIGLAALTVVRVQHRTAESVTAAADARLYARSMVETVIGLTAMTPNWRTLSQYSGGAVYGPVSIGRGTCSIRVIDEIDGDLANDPDQSVRIRTSGRVQDAVAYYSVLAEPPPLDCLRTAVHAAGLFTVDVGATLTLNGGAPAVCCAHASYGNGTFFNSAGATVNGNVEAYSITNSGTIRGTVRQIGRARELPASTTVAYYRGLATSIPWSSIPSAKIEKCILNHNTNPFGSANPDGLYAITMQANLTIENCRIKGTLVVDTGASRKLTIGKGISWEPHRPDYPALIVVGACEIAMETSLSEPTTGTNYNPEGFPYQEETDSDTLDTYPGVIEGVVYIENGPVTVRTATRIEGSLIVVGPVTVKNTVTVNYNPNHALNPPKRYRATRLNAVLGTWRRELSL